MSVGKFVEQAVAKVAKNFGQSFSTADELAQERVAMAVRIQTRRIIQEIKDWNDV